MWARERDGQERVAALARQFTVEHVLVLESRIAQLLKLVQLGASTGQGLSPDECRQLVAVLDPPP
jgi:hypothetical protein